MPQDKPTVLLLNEADKIVPLDRAQGWRLFRTLRALAHNGSLRLVLSGERMLRSALREETSPLFNYTEELLLRSLDFGAVHELVTQLMRRIEVDLVDTDAIVDCIYSFTAGHPNVVQRLCNRLVGRINERGTLQITLDDVEAVIHDPQFQEDDFLLTYWEMATPLERVISLLMSRAPGSRDLKGVLALLADNGLTPDPAIVKAALDRLVDLRSILRRDQDGYGFAVRAFPETLAASTTIDDQLVNLRGKCLENAEEWQL